MNNSVDLAPRRTLVGCSHCHFRSACGGLDGQQRIWGCFVDCQAGASCDVYDWTCPCKPREFIDRLGEVGGTLASAPVMISGSGAAITDLPLYVPMVQHGSRRRTSLKSDVVALPTFEVVGARRSGQYGPVERTATGLRRRFRVRRDSKVLLVSPVCDRELELYWAKRRVSGILSRLAALNLLGVTVPNFSYFADAPRTHTMWNRRRLEIVARELDEVGIRVIPHLNALTLADWECWRRLLIDNASIRFVAKEFQTGAGLEDVEQLARLQDGVGRSLHPLVIGGARFLRTLRPWFDSFTLVDSQPFMKTMQRKALSRFDEGSQFWNSAPTAATGTLDRLLGNNVRAYQRWVSQEAGEIRVARQLKLPGFGPSDRRHLPHPRRRSAA
jgi:hypothetical protein